MRLVAERARLADLDRIMELEEAGFAPAIRERRDCFEARLSAFPEGFFVLKEAGGHGPAQGYLCSEIWRRDGELDHHRFGLGHAIGERHDPHGEELYISSMTVHPSLRGAGTGRRFFSSCVAAMREGHRGLEGAVLLVHETWQRARRIYEGEGFVEHSRLHGFFEDEDGERRAGIVMRKAWSGNPGLGVKDLR